MMAEGEQRRVWSSSLRGWRTIQTRASPRRTSERWGTRAAWRARGRRGRPARRPLQRGLRLPFQHHRPLDSSPSPAMVRQPEGQGLDPGRGLTGSHHVGRAPRKEPVSRYGHSLRLAMKHIGKFGGRDRLQCALNYLFLYPCQHNSLSGWTPISRSNVNAVVPRAPILNPHFS